MKIPKYIRRTSSEFQAWSIKANEMSMEYGVFVEIVYTNRNNNTADLDSIQFKVMDHTFESLRDLRKALENKAFL